MPRSANVSTVARTSIAFLPSRSSLVTISTSPSSILRSSSANPGRWFALTLPEMLSITTRRLSTEKPATSISRSWFAAVWSVVLTRAYAKVRDMRCSQCVRKWCPNYSLCPKIAKPYFRTYSYTHVRNGTVSYMRTETTTDSCTTGGQGRRKAQRPGGSNCRRGISTRLSRKLPLLPVRALDLDAASGTLVGFYWKADHVKGKNSGSSIVRATMLNLTRSGFVSVRVSPLWTISASRCHSRGGHVAASTMPNEKCK